MVCGFHPAKSTQQTHWLNQRTNNNACYSMHMIMHLDWKYIHSLENPNWCRFQTVTSCILVKIFYHCAMVLWIEMIFCWKVLHIGISYVSWRNKGVLGHILVSQGWKVDFLLYHTLCSRYEDKVFDIGRIAWSGIIKDKFLLSLQNWRMWIL